MKWRYCIKLLVCRFPFLCYEYKIIDKQKLSERDSSDSKNSTVVTVNGAHKQYLANPWKCLVYGADSRCDSNWKRIKLLSTQRKPICGLEFLSGKFSQSISKADTGDLLAAVGDMW